MEWWPAYLAMGLFVGFFAGMLGIGGGVMLVPLMAFVFAAQAFPADRILHLALGTSLASIVFTSVTSLLAHHRRGAVRWDIVRRAAIPLVIGTLLGSFVADVLKSRYLAIVFVVFVYYSATRLFLDVRPKPTRQLPGAFGLWIAATVIGVISSLVGAGGGVISIPLMTMCNVPMRNAVGTSAALGLPIALAGTAGYAFHGVGLDQLPAWSMGYIYLPALSGIVLGTLLTVPLGAKAAHRMPVPLLQKIFAAILFLLASHMLWSLYAAN
jgi:uncharacterized membrane protein YfcA